MYIYIVILMIYDANSAPYCIQGSKPPLFHPKNMTANETKLLIGSYYRNQFQWLLDLELFLNCILHICV